MKVVSKLVPYLTMIFERLRVTNDRLLIALDKLNDSNLLLSIAIKVYLAQGRPRSKF